MLTLMFCCLVAMRQATAPAAPAPAASAPAAAGANRDFAHWLIDTGRNYGHLAGRDDPRRVTLHVLALMKAAAEIDPKNADAWLWQYDILGRMQRDDEALDALTKYIALDPDDESAALQQLALCLAQLQTAEARGAFLVEKLRQPDLSRVIRSDVHRRLAEFYRERHQDTEASKQIEQALRLMSLNLAARALAYEMSGATEPILTRVEMALQLILMNPSDVNVLWDLGQLLDSCGMHREAREWYVQALSIHRRGTQQSVGADKLLDLAVSYAGDSQFAECLQTLGQILAADPNNFRARMLRIHVAQRAADADGKHREAMLALAKSDVEALAKRFDASFDAVVKNKNASAAAEMTWFYGLVAPDAKKALAMAEVATTGTDPDASGRRVMGFALLANDRAAEAQKQFAPLAEADQMSAYGMGISLVRQSKRAEAIAALQAGARLRPTGVAFDYIATALRSLGETPPEPPKYPKIKEVLNAFDRRVFDLYLRPSDTLKLTLEFIDEPLPAVGFCRMRIRLQNINPPDSFSITLGDGLMIRPRVMLSAQRGGRDGKSYRNYTEVMLNRKPVLAPGESIERVMAVDVGQLHEDLLTNANVAQEIEITAVLDPIKLQGEYVSGLGSVFSLPIKATRPALPTHAAGLEGMVALAASTHENDRVAAARRLGAILAVRDRSIEPFAGAGAIAAAGVEPALMRLVSDSEWMVRAAALDALRSGRPQGRTIAERVASVLNDPSMPVRLMAVRLMATVQPGEFAKALPRIAQSDPSLPVRILARSYILPAVEFPSAATQAASGSGE